MHPLPIVIAITQPRRHLGVSTFAYYLAREIATRGVRLVLADATERPQRILQIWREETPKELLAGPTQLFNYYVIPDVYAKPLSVRIAGGRTDGAARRVRLVILDLDPAIISHFREDDPGLDYSFILTSSAQRDQQAVEALAQHLAGGRDVRDAVGVIVARVNPSEVHEAPAHLHNLHTPIVGVLPADYGMAGGAEYSAGGLKPARPRTAYLDAVHGLAELIMRRFDLVN
jgi:Mrp family chromosome partitioning ATPase